MNKYLKYNKILMVHDTIDPSHGGSIERSMQITKALVDRGYHIDLLSLKRNFHQDYAKKNGINKYFIFKSIKFKYLLPLINPFTLAKICKDYDIIHISKNWSLLSFFVAKIAKKNNVPYIFSPMGWVSFTNNKSQLFKEIYFKFCTNFILKNCYYVITVSNNEYIDCCNYIKNVIQIPNGYRQDDFNLPHINDFKKKYNLLDKKIFLFLGRMDPIKGVDLLIKAFNDLHYKNDEWQLVLIGTKNKYRNTLIKNVENSKCKDKIFFIDPIFDFEKVKAYYACDVFVIPSIHDAMTIVAVEAAACGKPIIITKSSDFKEIYLSGGAIETDATINGITSALSKAIDLNNDDLKEIGINAKDFVRKKYEWNYLTILYENIFNMNL
jgi:glycosyltransferase involved in cell wall biosynthesis